MKNMKRRALWITGVMTLGLVIGASVGVPHGDLSAETEELVPALLVEVVVIQLQDGYEMTRLFSGLVQARRDSVLGFERSGRLTRVYVEEGAMVREGEILAELDTERLRAQRAELGAAMEEAEASLALAEATSTRMQGVIRAGGVSRHELDVALKGERAARAALELARRRISTVDTELAKSKLYAPFAGAIVQRSADEGRVVGVGEPVLRLQSGTSPEIRIAVAGVMVDMLRTGQTYVLEWRSGREIRARLRAVLPLRAVAARTVDALFEPLGDSAELRPGDLATLRLASQVAEPGAWLPVTALTEGERGLWNVYVAQPVVDGNVPSGLSATHRLARRTVDVIYQEADRVYVRGALTPEDQVVVSGLQRIVPEQWVRIFPAVAAQGG